MANDRAYRSWIAAGGIAAVVICVIVLRMRAEPHGSGEKNAAATRNPLEPGRRPGGRVVQIKASEIGKSVQIIGRLGRPLMEVISIRGHWVDRPLRPAGLGFRVTQVNGENLDPPVTFDRPLVTFTNSRYPKTQEGPVPTAGDVWELRGMETGRFHGLPTEFWEPAPAPAQLYRGFQTEIQYAAYERIGVSE